MHELTVHLQWAAPVLVTGDTEEGSAVPCCEEVRVGLSQKCKV